MADQSSAAVPNVALQKPKKVASAYWLFTNAMRETVSKELKEKNYGKAKLGDIAKEIGSRFAALSEAEKKVYEDKVDEDKKRYAAELDVYLKASDPAGTLRTKYKDMIPKKPVTAYFAYTMNATMKAKAVEALKAAGNQEPAHKQVMSKLGELWKLATAEEKTPFETQYKKDHAEFLEKQKAWQATPEFAEIEKAEAEQEQREKAAEAEEQQQQQQQQQPEEKGKKRGRSSSKEKPTPSKAQKTDDAKDKSPKEKLAKANVSPPAIKRTAKADSKKGAPAEPEIDAAVLAEAAPLGFESGLRNLARRPEIAASGKTAAQLLEALKASNGLVNPAKRALLGE